MYVYPRLSRGDARVRLGELGAATVERRREASALEHPSAAYYPTGQRVAGAVLSGLRDRLRELARDAGYPFPGGKGSKGNTAFDRQATALLVAGMDIVPADAADEGVWSFLSLVLCPDVAMWRYPPTERSADERMIGRDRHVFGRLWWRGHILGPGADEPAQLLSEDQLVALMERPSIGRNPRLARGVAVRYLTACEDRPALRGQDGMRDVAKRLRRLMAVVDLASLGDDALSDTLNGVLAASEAALSRAPSVGDGPSERDPGTSQAPGAATEDSAREVLPPGLRRVLRWFERA